MWLTVMIFIEPPISFIQISPLRRSMVAYLGSYKKSRQKIYPLIADLSKCSSTTSAPATASKTA